MGRSASHPGHEGPIFLGLEQEAPERETPVGAEVFSNLGDMDWRGSTPMWLADTATSHLNKPFLAYAHTVHIHDKIMALFRGDYLRLTISTPPQHGKSQLMAFSMAWAICVLKWRVIVICYQVKLAKRISKEVRDIVQRWGHLYGVSLDRSKHGVLEWQLEGHEAGLKAVGIGGDITGNRADLIVIDDPIKSFAEAMSETIRQNVKDAIITCAESRLSKNGRIVIIQTRWHQDDPIGWALASNKDRDLKFQYHECTLPAMAYAEEEKPFPDYVDPLGREPGQVLCEGLQGLEQMRDRRTSCTPYMWSSLYQGRPQVEDGAFISRSWWNYWQPQVDTISIEDVLLRYDSINRCWFYPNWNQSFDEVIQSWDFPWKDTKDSTWTVGQVWGRIGHRLYLLHQIRKRLKLPDMVKEFMTMQQLFPMTNTRIIEMEGSGPKVKKQVQRIIPGVIGSEPRGPKEARVAVISIYIASGFVYLPEPSIYGNVSDPWFWVHGFLGEHTSFPTGSSDDQVDCTSQVLKYCQSYMIPHLDSVPDGSNNWSIGQAELKTIPGSAPAPGSTPTSSPVQMRNGSPITQPLRSHNPQPLAPLNFFKRPR